MCFSFWCQLVANDPSSGKSSLHRNSLHTELDHAVAAAEVAERSKKKSPKSAKSILGHDDSSDDDDYVSSSSSDNDAEETINQMMRTFWSFTDN